MFSLLGLSVGQQVIKLGQREMKVPFKVSVIQIQLLQVDGESQRTLGESD